MRPQNTYILAIFVALLGTGCDSVINQIESAFEVQVDDGVCVGFLPPQVYEIEDTVGVSDSYWSELSKHTASEFRRRLIAKQGIESQHVEIFDVWKLSVKPEECGDTTNGVIAEHVDYQSCMLAWSREMKSRGLINCTGGKSMFSFGAIFIVDGDTLYSQANLQAVKSFERNQENFEGNWTKYKRNSSLLGRELGTSYDRILSRRLNR